MIEYTGKYCPNCHCATIVRPNGEDICDVDGGYFTRDCRCSECGSTWKEVFDGLRVRSLVIPKPPDPVQNLLEVAVTLNSILRGGVDIHYEPHRAKYESVRARFSAAIDAVKLSEGEL